jgi:hypothetical protein
MRLGENTSKHAPLFSFHIPFPSHKHFFYIVGVLEIEIRFFI